MPGAGGSQAIDKKYLDFIEACNRCHCGCCKDGCPIYATMLEEQTSARGRNSIIRAYLMGEIEPDARMARAVYSCLLCRLDEESCAARIPNAEIYEYIRERLFSLGIGPLPEHEPLLASLRNYGNPWMQPKSARERWVRQAKAGKNDSNGDLYFAGCTFSLAPEIASVPVAVMRLLALAGEDFSVLGHDEICCGSTALRVGDRKLFEQLSEENAKRISKYDRVVTSCAGCYKTIGQDYKGKAAPKQLMHSVEMLWQLIESGKLKPKELKAKVTYHDPCHLGRHSKLYDQPRNIIKSIPGVELVEMKNSRELARCCGAGAGVKTANPLVSLDIAKRRVAEAVQTGAHILVSACPFCEQNLREAASAMNSDIRVLDISELLLESCE